MENHGSHFARPCPPLLPECSFLHSDVGPLISELFQDISNDRTISPKAVRNLTETCPQYSDLYAFAWDIKKFYFHQQRFIQLIDNAERALIISHANYLNKELEISKDNFLLDQHRWSRDPLFRESDIPEEFVKQLKLLRYRDIIPQFVIDLDFYPDPSEELSKCDYNIIKQYDSSKTYELEKGKPEKHFSNNCTCLIIEPRKIVFRKYQKGKTYQKTCYLFNTSNHSIRYIIDPYFKNSAFKIKSRNGLNKSVIAPGMKIFLDVIFKPENLLILHENLKIEEYWSRGSQEIRLPHALVLEANPHPPILQVEPNTWINPSLIREDYEIIKTSTIECGKCFVGDCTCLKIVLKNIGLGDGTFYFISEEAWYLGKIKELTLSNTLELNSFSIEPCYFTVCSGEFISLSVHFKPLSSGVQTQRLFLLSENCTVRILDLIGDGLCFHKKFINIQDIKKYSVEIEDDQNVNYYINMGVLNPNSSGNIHFTIENVCSLPLHFRWEKRHANIMHFPAAKNIKDLKLEFVNVSPEIGCLKSRKESIFNLNINLFDNPLGKHRLILSLILENLPLACFLEDSCKCVSAAPRFITQEPSLDVYLAEIELFLNVKPIEVILSQPFLIFAENFKPLESMEGEVSVLNPHLFPLICHWEYNNSCTHALKGSSPISVYPNFFVLPGFTEINCTFRITPNDQPGPFICQARCVMNYLESDIQITIMGQVDKPNIVPSTNHLDFGVVTRGSRQSITFEIENKSLLDAVWLMREFVWDQDSNSFTEYSQTHLNHVSGILKGSNVKLRYDLNTMIQGFWVSILTLNIISKEDYSAPLQFSSHILVTAFREEPSLLIEDDHENFKFILKLGEVLYPKLKFQTKIILRNPGRVESSFKIGLPFGCHSYIFDLSFEPSFNKIPPLSSCEIEINIFPKDQGYADHVYIPIWLSFVRLPLILNLIAFVEGPHVSFDFTECEDNKIENFTKRVPWSTRGRAYPFFQLPPEDQQLLKPPCRCNPKYYFERVNNKIPNVSLRLLENGETIFEDPLEEEIKLESGIESLHLRPHGNPIPKHISATCFCGPISEIPPYHKQKSHSKQLLEKYEIGTCPDPNIFYNPDGTIGMIRSILRDDDRYSSSVDISKQPFVLHSRSPLRQRFSPISLSRDLEMENENEFFSPFDQEESENRSVFFNEVAEFRPAYLNTENFGIQIGIFSFIDFHLQYRQAVKKSFTIVNPTPMEINYRMCLTNFHMKYYPKYSLSNILNKLVAEVRGLPSDAWKDRLGDAPILFKIDNESGTLLPFESNQITIWVYSSTWGVYTDKLVIEMTGLPNFVIRLSAEVNAFPLELPALKCQEDYYIMRLGKLSCSNSCNTRWIRICNRSSIAISLSWHIFHYLDFETPTFPFNLIMDPVPCWDEKRRLFREGFEKLFPFQLRFIDFLGREINGLFEINPPFCIIPKYSEQKFQIKFNPSLLNKNEEFEYQMISFLEIDYKESLKIDHFMRPSFLLYQPLKILIQGKVEIPKLSIHTENYQVCVSAFEIMSSKTSSWTNEQNICISNCSHVPTTVTITIDVPFYISKIKNKFGECKIDSGKFFIEAEDILEVKIGCYSNLNMLYEAIGYYKKNITSDFSEIWEYKIKSLFQIKQYSEYSQVVNFSLKIIFPMLDPFPMVLDFGEVLIENNKSSYFTIQNLGANQLNIMISSLLKQVFQAGKVK